MMVCSAGATKFLTSHVNPVDGIGGVGCHEVCDQSFALCCLLVADCSISPGNHGTYFEMIFEVNLD